MTDALLWLGQVETVKNWDYVRFQRPDSPTSWQFYPPTPAQLIGPPSSRREWTRTAAFTATGCRAIRCGHWRARPTSRTPTSSTVSRRTAAGSRNASHPSTGRRISWRRWSRREGAVRGAGYYMERPTRVEYDGVAQCHAVDAFRAPR